MLIRNARFHWKREREGEERVFASEFARIGIRFFIKCIVQFHNRRGIKREFISNTHTNSLPKTHFLSHKLVDGFPHLGGLLLRSGVVTVIQRVRKPHSHPANGQSHCVLPRKALWIIVPLLIHNLCVWIAVGEPRGEGLHRESPPCSPVIRCRLIEELYHVAIA